MVERIQSQASLLATGTGPGQSALASALRIMQTPAMEPLTVAPGNESSTLFVPGTTDREAFAAAGAQALPAQSVHRRGADVLDVKTIPQDFSGSTAIIPAGALTTAHLMLPGEGAQPQEREVYLCTAFACTGYYRGRMLTTSLVVPDKSFSRMSFSCAVVACLFADSSVVASELQSTHGYNVKGVGPMPDKKHIFAQVRATSNSFHEVLEKVVDAADMMMTKEASRVIRLVQILTMVDSESPMLCSDDMSEC